jgi:hypothetical protein
MDCDNRYMGSRSLSENLEGEQDLAAQVVSLLSLEALARRHRPQPQRDRQYGTGVCAAEKISFNQINKKTGHRIRYLKVDAETGDEVASEDIIKGYKVDTDQYLEVTKDELENIALESTRTIDIDEFVPGSRSTTFNS